MRWSDRPWAMPLYALAAALALGELAVVWLMLHPNVPSDYRAYYIDRTTTCLPQPVTAAYTLGTIVDFRSGGPDTRELRPCGWEGPAGDGMHALGESARLAFAVPAQDLTLTLEMTGVTLPGPRQQTVIVSANGQPLGRAVVTPGKTGRFTFPLPASAIANGRADIILDLPDAVTTSPGQSNVRKRSIKLVKASLTPATASSTP
ncbi:hypothetical protein FF80_01252 [Devosia sp. LC5]|uniref:hypothetical protein n=1 Tax=Devosia sp. LC5 TaxID=1502724 RepID=UPI0004E2B185|nr:hypothetical protein [Devosia sp. LC5]KFC69748.1 hypothetical protein FF80_01252 [Devosia sp. LC5]